MQKCPPRQSQIPPNAQILQNQSGITDISFAIPQKFEIVIQVTLIKKWMAETDKKVSMEFHSKVIILLPKVNLAVQSSLHKRIKLEYRSPKRKSSGIVQRILHLPSQCKVPHTDELLVIHLRRKVECHLEAKGLRK